MSTLDRSEMPIRPRLTLVGVLGLSFLSILFSIPGWAQQQYSGEGAAACLACHESATVMGMRKTPHANFEDPKSPASREQCESCHGPSATHMQFPMQVGNIVFSHHAKTPIADRNQACLACHNKGGKTHWSEGGHGKKLSCAACHTMHKPADPGLVKKNQTKDCGKCHPDILETAPVTATHPLTGEKAMYCTLCHNPHGPTNLKSCIGCHAQDPQTLAKQSAKAQDYHGRGISEKVDCTDCHKGFVHAMEPITFATRPDKDEPVHP
jgi:predicted CXXCH cytochrome family protein